MTRHHGTYDGLGTVLRDIYEEVIARPAEGAVASYIPELSKVNKDKFGIHLTTLHGEQYHQGDSNEPFSVQSISKVLSLSMAFSILGEELWQRIGVEPSGGGFDSIMELEHHGGIPRNPFINAGALVVADVLISHLSDPEKEYLGFVRALSGNPNVDTDPAIARSEASVGYMNAALINVLKYRGNIRNDLNRVLRFYFFQCSLSMTCRDLAHAFVPFADHGQAFRFGGTELTRSQVKRINALMMTCGFYDESGDFCYRVGLPGKSGVGGGIAAIHPGEYAVVVWSPGLNPKGNSVRGMQVLELLTTRTNRSIF